MKSKGLLKGIGARIFICALSAVLLTSCRCEETLSVGTARLNIETYKAGKNQVTHPSVISFDKEWNGYKYWMVYTPYPEANGEEENPSIAVSNDLYKWETPYGMVNPIADNEETGCNELKDGHILYREDLNRLEVWYLGRVSENIGGDGESLTLFRKCSEDGITWSPYEIMDEVSYLSPSVIWKDGKYQMWSIGFGMADAPANTFVYQESPDGKNWSNPQLCSIGDRTETAMWHGAVNYDSQTKKYRYVYIPNSGNSQDIYACESKDGVQFTNEIKVVENSRSTLWNHFYRPCLLSENGMQHLFYGVVTDENKWYLSYSRGENLENLKGITEADASKMVNLNEVVTDTKSIRYIIKKVYHSIGDSFRIELGILVIVLGLLQHILHKRKKQFAGLQILGTILICCLYTYWKFRPAELYTWIGCFAASMMEGISIYSISKVWLSTICRNK